MSKTVQEIIQAKREAESKINSILAKFAHDNEVFDLSIYIDKTLVKAVGTDFPVGIAFNTEIKVKI